MALDKLKRSLSKSVYLDIKHKILNNELMPSDRLIEMAIAEDLDVSRTPVREALKELEAEDLVENYPRKGYVVAKISIKTARDLYEVRRVLEPKVVEKIVLNSSDVEVSRLRSVVEKMQKNYESGNKDAISESFVEWNMTLIDLVDNKVMQEIMINVNERLYRFANYIFRSEKNVTVLYNSILSIFTAIEKQDAKGASRKAGKFVDLLTNMLEEQSDYRMFKE